MELRNNFALASFSGRSSGRAKNERELAVTSQELQILNRKSSCKMLIDGDDISNDEITHGAPMTVLFFLVPSYSPLIVVNILIRISFIESSCAAHIALAIACFLIILNSLINPTIYCIRRRQFRVAFIEILLRKGNVEAQETEMRMNRAEARLRWRSQNNEQKNSLSTANNTVKCGVNNIGCDKDQYSIFNSITYTNSKNKSDNIISGNNTDNSKNSIGGLS